MNIKLTLNHATATSAKPTLIEKLDLLDFLLVQRAPIETRFRDIYDAALAEMQAGSAHKFSENLAAAYDAEFKTFLAKAPDDRSRDALRQVLTDVSERHLNRASRDEQAGRVGDRAMGTEALLTQYTNLAELYPENAEAYMASGEDALTRLAQSGVVPAAIEERLHSFRAELIHAALYGAAKIDPEISEAMLQHPEINQWIENEAEIARYEELIEFSRQAAEEDRKLEHDRLEQLEFIANLQERLHFQGDFAAALNTGSASHGMIAKAFYKDLINEQEMATMEGQLADYRAARQKQMELAELTRQILRAGNQLNARIPEHREAADAHYEIFISALDEGQSDEARKRIEDDYIVQLGIVPTPLLKLMHGQLLSDQAETLVKVSQRLNKLAKDSKVLESLTIGMPASVLARARVNTLYDGLGIPPLKMVNLATQKLIQKLAPRQKVAKARRRKLDMRGQIGRLAQLGRHGDTELASLSRGEMIIPRTMMRGALKDELYETFQSAGVEPSRYVVAANA